MDINSNTQDGHKYIKSVCVIENITSGEILVWVGLRAYIMIIRVNQAGLDISKVFSTHPGIIMPKKPLNAFAIFSLLLRMRPGAVS